jgi:hypothetical protein
LIKAANADGFEIQEHKIGCWVVRFGDRVMTKQFHALRQAENRMVEVWDDGREESKMTDAEACVDALYALDDEEASLDLLLQFVEDAGFKSVADAYRDVGNKFRRRQ